jgi:lysophospholipase L1-like esterase
VSYEPWENLSYYEQQEWSADYWREATPLTGTYQPYVSWKSSPHHGDLINIDESGLRVTPNSEEDNPSLSIFCFGGSTMWGWGSPDWGTIPAYLAEIINAQFKEESVKVVNFGQRTYISSQEVIQLIEEIKHGNVPDIVIFYDGVNDVGYAYMFGQAGVPYDMWQIYRQGHIEAVRPQETKYQKFINLLLDLNTSRVVRGGLSIVFSPGPFQGKGIDIDELSPETVSIYLHNMDIVDALSKKYGFDYYFFWQPSLYEESKPLTLEEQEIRGSLVTASGSESIEFRHAVYSLVKSEAEKRHNLYYIADVFNDTQDFMFLDGAHLIPEGNKLVAERIVDIIADSIAH